jgi:hypothetical protein
MNKILSILSFVILLSLISCKNLPKEGEFYEHKGTKDRIKIQYFGNGQSAYKYCRSMAKDQNNIYKKSRGYEPIKIKYSDIDSIKECVVFFQEGDIKSNTFVTYYNVITAEELQKDYILVQ